MSNFLNRRIKANARRDEWFLMKNRPPERWYVYIVRCSDDTYYTGITKDITRRMIEHNSKPTGAKYTRSRRPVTLVVSTEVDSRSTALKLEYRVKSLKRSKKVDFLRLHRSK